MLLIYLNCEKQAAISRKMKEIRNLSKLYTKGIGKSLGVPHLNGEALTHPLQRRYVFSVLKP
jgi:hypothetical protein